jgi:uncharacterized protein (TIGR02117 family)
MKSPHFVLILLLLAACSGKPYVVEPQLEADATRSHTVYVVSHGWHAGLVVPGGELNQVVPELKTRFGNVAFYELGWGDKGFYQSQEITTGLTLQAMFWSEGAVMHVVAVPHSPLEYFPGEEIIDTCLSDHELLSLKTFIADSFEHDAAGHAISLRRGIYGESQFYDGVGRYYLLNTCNKWTAKALRSAGLDISPTLKLTSGSIMSYLGVHRKGCTNQSK